jgi:hypothetical protein
MMSSLNAPAGKMLLQSGTTPRKRKEFTAAMAANPDVIYAFPRGKDGEFERCLKIFDNVDQKIGRLDSRIVRIPLSDPGRKSPWSEDDLKLFKSMAVRAAGDLTSGKRVLVVCVVGANRSRALARSAARLAGMETDIEPAQDATLERVVDAISDDEDLASLAPFGLCDRPKRRRCA